MIIPSGYLPVFLLLTHQSAMTTQPPKVTRSVLEYTVRYWDSPVYSHTLGSRLINELNTQCPISLYL